MSSIGTGNNKSESQEIVSRVYTKYGVSYIGDTKYCGCTNMTMKSFVTMINNGQMDAVISPPRRKNDLRARPPVPVIKYTLETTLSPQEMYEQYFEHIKSGQPLNENSLIEITETSTELVISERKKDVMANKSKTGYGFYWNLKDDIEHSPRKKMKMDSCSFGPSSVESATSSTATTIVFDSSDIDKSTSPTSSTAETVTYENIGNFDCACDIINSRASRTNMGKTEPPIHSRTTLLIEALDLCEQWDGQLRAVIQQVN